jgi:predicted DsbA family dithiol-disulfide isomerase
VIRLYSDFACPFCYLAEVGARRLEIEGRAIDYRAYELRPAPYPLESPGADPAKVAGWERGVAPAAKALGITMQMPTFGVRTRKAHEAARLARVLGRERPMRDALFAAYFAEGRDIGRIDVLTRIAGEVGLDITEMKVTLDIDQYSDEVALEASEASAMGLQGVPAYVDLDHEPPRALIGLREYDTVLKWWGDQ